MDHYYLFRGDQLIYSNEGQLLGAGHAHERGQEGDVLIHNDKGQLTGFRWQLQTRDDLPWPVIPQAELDQQHYKVLLLIQK